MGWIIVTDSGGISHTPLGSKSPTWDNKADAQARCDKANADAEALDIKTRYEIKEAT